MDKDKQIKCIDCEETFTLTEGESEWYQQKGFNEPKRCKDCREKKKLTNWSVNNKQNR